MMAMFGKLAWDHAIKVIFGIAIVFGAASVIDALSGGMAGSVAG
jgi:type IV secretory pathway VirB2 component (pilin)